MLFDKCAVSAQCHQSLVKNGVFSFFSFFQRLSRPATVILPLIMMIVIISTPAFAAGQEGDGADKLTPSQVAAEVDKVKSDVKDIKATINNLSDTVDQLNAKRPAKMIVPSSEIPYLFEIAFVGAGVKRTTVKEGVGSEVSLKINSVLDKYKLKSIEPRIVNGLDAFEDDAGTEKYQGGEQDLLLAELEILEAFYQLKEAEGCGASPASDDCMKKRINRLHLAINNVDWEHDNLYLGILEGSTPDGLYTSIVLHAYPGYRRFIPSRFPDLQRRFSFFFAIGTMTGPKDQSVNSTNIYSLGAGIDIEKGFILDAGVAVYKLSSSPNYTVAGTVGVTLNSAFFKDMYK